MLAEMSILWFKIHLSFSGNSDILFAQFVNGPNITQHVKYFYRTHGQNSQLCWRLQKTLHKLGKFSIAPVEIYYLCNNSVYKTVIDLQQESELIFSRELDFGIISLENLYGQKIS